jgi:pimeloyl-ACP methyl ester carboxylesterase
VVWDGGGPTLLLLHGDMRTSRSFDAVARELKGEFRVVALDARGHGSSDWPPTGYSIRDRVDDLTAFCDAIGVVDAVGIGHSLGGGIVALCAEQSPRTFASLFLLEPDFSFDDEFYSRGVRRKSRPPRTWSSLSELQTHLRQHKMAGRWRDDVLQDVVLHEAMEIEDGSIVMKWAMQSLDISDGTDGPYDLRPMFKGLKMPVSFIFGEETASNYADLSSIATERPDFSSVTVTRAGHNMYRERPDAVAGLIKSFVAGEDLPHAV